MVSTSWQSVSSYRDHLLLGSNLNSLAAFCSNSFIIRQFSWIGPLSSLIWVNLSKFSRSVYVSSSVLPQDTQKLGSVADRLFFFLFFFPSPLLFVFSVQELPSLKSNFSAGTEPASYFCYVISLLAVWINWNRKIYQLLQNPLSSEARRDSDYFFFLLRFKYIFIPFPVQKNLRETQPQWSLWWPFSYQQIVFCLPCV